MSRGTGLFNNELYVGRLVWNRQRYIKDPSTGKRVSRLNPREDWITTEVPELRLVGDALWQAVRARQAELGHVFAATTIGLREARAKRFNAARRPAFLLSGLLSCGGCQGRYGIILQDRYGCLNHFRRGSCNNNRTIERTVIEQRALSGLTEKLVSAEAVAEAGRGYHEAQPPKAGAPRADRSGPAGAPQAGAGDCGHHCRDRDSTWSRSTACRRSILARRKGRS